MSQTKVISIWLIGLSGSGKTTLAKLLKEHLVSKGIKVVTLDGDEMRSGLNSDLKFSDADRFENIRRAAEVSKLFLQEQIITINSFICPTNSIRAKAKEIIGTGNFYLVWLNAPISVCEARDAKGLYSKVRKGELHDFTGIDSLFEAPENPFFEIKTDKLSIHQSIELLMQKLTPVIFN